MTVFTTMDELKRMQISDMLSEGKRVDGRAFDEHRQISIETGVIPILPSRQGHPMNQ